MSQNITNISIPTPCHQSWGDMTPTAGGRHCDSCCKTVVDFTRMSDQQIINFLSEGQKTCGRIEPWQISSINSGYLKKQGQLSWKVALVAAYLLVSPLTDTIAQHKPKAKIHRIKVKPAKIECYRTVSGKIVDSANRTSLPGAIIIVKGRGISTTADLNGSFTINVPESADTLVVRSSGYHDQQIKVGADDADLEVALAEQYKACVVGSIVRSRTTITGAIVVINKVEIDHPASPFYKRWFYRLILKPVKTIFS